MSRPPSPPPSADEPITGGTWLTQRKIGVLDLETRCSAADVGGWGQCHLMGVSLAVLHETHTGVATTYREHDLERLGQRLTKLDLVVGFNIKRFDYRVFQPYTKVRLAEVPTLDILEEVYTSLGTRLSLNHLADKTLGEKKTGDGLLALELFAEGKWEELDSYCRQDVPSPIASSSSGRNTATCSTNTARAAWCGCRWIGGRSAFSPNSAKRTMDLAQISRGHCPPDLLNLKTRNSKPKSLFSLPFALICIIIRRKNPKGGHDETDQEGYSSGLLSGAGSLFLCRAVVCRGGPKVGQVLGAVKFAKPLTDEDAKYLGLAKAEEFTLKDVKSPYILIEQFNTTCPIACIRPRA